MAVSLRQLYEGVSHAEEIQLVAGETGLDHPVRWVHMVEGTDISSFLEGDEVAFATGIALKGTEDLLELVKYNQKQGAAGMVINVGPYIEEIPPEVIAFGNEKEFPIFRVPWRVHMANIMREFTTQINMDDFKEMEVEAALKNAVFLPENTDMYLPALKKHGYKKEWSYCAAVLEVWDKTGMRMTEKFKKKLLHYAADFFRAYQRQSVVLENDGAMAVFFCNVTEDAVKEQLSLFVGRVREYLSEDFCCYMGIGRCAGDMRRIAVSFAQAEQVRRLQKKRGRKNEPVLYSELGLYKLLFSLENQEIMEEYYAETLGILEKYDHVNETDYLYFLSKYFALDCSVQELAAQMHLHRNSVTYKLHKIEEILKLSVNDPADRTKLMVALMLREIR